MFGVLSADILISIKTGSASIRIVAIYAQVAAKSFATRLWASGIRFGQLKIFWGSYRGSPRERGKRCHFDSATIQAVYKSGVRTRQLFGLQKSARKRASMCTPTNKRAIFPPVTTRS